MSLIGNLERGVGLGMGAAAGERVAKYAGQHSSGRYSDYIHKADQGLQGLGTIGVYECVIKGGIMMVIGFALMHWANNIRDGVVEASNC